MKTAIRSTHGFLRLIVYCDETVSGNPLNPVASKILGYIYVAFVISSSTSIVLCPNVCVIYLHFQIF